MLKALEQRINHRYGSKRGFVRYCMHRGLDLAGRYRKYRQIDWGRVERLVFVCSGNICRSPLAERVALDAGYNATSFGLHCTPGRPADPRVVELAGQRGYDLRNHATRSHHDIDPGATDLVVAMEPAQLSELTSATLFSGQQTLLGVWLLPPTPYIHDPYSAGLIYFERCVHVIESATKQLLLACASKAKNGYE